MKIQAGHYYRDNKGNVWHCIGIQKHHKGCPIIESVDGVWDWWWVDSDDCFHRGRIVEHLGDKWPVPPKVTYIEEQDLVPYIELTAEVRSALEEAGIEVRE